MSTNNEDINQNYSSFGYRIKSTFTHEDFLDNPDTRAVLEEEFRIKLHKVIENNVVSFYEHLKEYEENVASGMLRLDNGQGISELMAIITNNVKKNYNFETFYLNPELAEPLLIEYEIIKDI